MPADEHNREHGAGFQLNREQSATKNILLFKGSLIIRQDKQIVVGLGSGIAACP
jgi:hypothetical protein